MKISTLAVLILLCFSRVLQFCHGLDHESTMRVLLEVKSSFLEDPQNVLREWSENNTDYCGWRGVSCGLNDSDQVVVGLDLYNSSLVGSISPSLGRLNDLLFLDLSYNRLTGSIPPQFGNLGNLQHLRLDRNFLNGTIPREVYGLVGLTKLLLEMNTLVGSISPLIGNLRNLVKLKLSHNNLLGTLPREIGKLGKLEILDLRRNQLSGKIPISIGNCSNLREIFLSGNHLSGGIPVTFGGLKELRFLDLGQNELVGEIPSTLGFLTNLKLLSLYSNFLQGSLPQQLENLTNLSNVTISKNGLNGSVAPLCSSRLFVEFDVKDNAFDGEIPSQLGNSPLLKRLSLGNNNFSGEIPRSLGKISELSFLDLSQNSLKGKIPKELSLCSKLRYIALNNNLLSGRMPSWLGNLLLLGELKLSSNHFFGPIPPSLFQLPRLRVLSLDSNSFSGNIPDVGFPESIEVIRLDNNNFSGPVPRSIVNLINIYELQLSRNSLSGEIPIEIGNLLNLETILNISYNNLSGHIPASLGMLSKLEELDLSHNQLTGEVPLPIGEMRSLLKLDISYNDFEGELDKQFSHWPYEAFKGNQHLCGASLGSCNRCGASHNKLSSLTVVIISVIAISAVAIIALAILVARFFLKNKQESSEEGIELNYVLPLNADGWRDFSFEEIMGATNNFSDDFKIGSGGSGSVYRVELPTGETVAVKKISWEDKSFRREVETLGRIKHRHLVKLMGCCSHRNEGTCLLIYENMENGSLWDWLHRKPLEANGWLDWDSRFKIALGLAQGVEYLQNDCAPKIVHRDIKSSNILLDSKMDAHLGDFGLAKAIIENHESNSCFAGSYGYIAPEYAYTQKATEKSDVYSMGIVLMELVIGKMPTDATFKGDMDMVRWVEQGIIRGEELIDPMLKPILPDEEFAASEVLKIAIWCTKSTPQERPSSREVCNLLFQVSNQNTPGG